MSSRQDQIASDMRFNITRHDTCSHNNLSEWTKKTSVVVNCSVQSKTTRVFPATYPIHVVGLKTEAIETQFEQARACHDTPLNSMLSFPLAVFGSLISPPSTSMACKS